MFENAATFLCFQSILIFQPFPSQKAAHRHTNFLKTVCILAFPSFANVLILYFAFLFDFLFLQWGLQKYTFSGCQFQKERTISLWLLAKVLKLISLVIDILEQKNYDSFFLTPIFLLKQLNEKGSKHNRNQVYVSGNKFMTRTDRKTK